MVSKDDNARLGSHREKVFVLLHSEDAHRGNGAGGPFLTKSPVLAESYLLVGPHALDGVLFFVEAVEPDLAVGVAVGQSLEQG